MAPPNLENHRSKSVDAEFADLLPLVSRALQRSAFGMIRKAGCTNAQFWILKWISIHGPFTMSGLADWLNLRMPSVSAIVDDLVKAGFIARTRSERDRRVVMIDATAKGRKLLRSIDAEIARVAARAAADVPAADKRAAVRVLRHVAETLESRPPAARNPTGR